MIEILVMLFGVLPWFYRTAKSRGKSPFGWALVGALSYYGPLVLVDRVILPPFLKDLVTMDNIVALNILKVLLAVGVGIGCCVVARRILISSGPSGEAPAAAEPGLSPVPARAVVPGVIKILAGAFIVAELARTILQFAFFLVEHGRIPWGFLNVWDLNVLLFALGFGFVLSKNWSVFRTLVWWGALTAVLNTVTAQFAHHFFSHFDLVWILARMGWWCFVSVVAMASFLVAAGLRRPAAWSFAGIKAVTGVVVGILWFAVRPLLEMPNPLDGAAAKPESWFAAIDLMLVARWAAMDLATGAVIYFGFKMAGRFGPGSPGAPKEG